ncbi:MAG: D-alanine--poly(phosphoribitol) ligase subunit DltA [Chthoniobacteraceae bacterium]
MHLLDRIDRWVRETPERAAHVSGTRTMTYRELGARSDALAAWLDAELGESRAPIAIRGHKEPEMLVGFLGAAKSGRPYVPIDLSIPEQRAERIVATSGAAKVLTPEVIDTITNAQATGGPRRRVEGDEAFYVLFTSGSTGEPKGVIITLANLEHFVAWMLAEQRFGEGSDVFLNQAPFSFDLSVMDLYCSLVTGATLVSVTKDDIANLRNLYEVFRRSPITSWVSTPSFAAMCLIEKTFAQPMLPALRRFLFCGETLPNEVAAALLDRFPDAEVWNTYGPTEATVATTSIRVDRGVLAEFSPLPVGAAMPGTRLFVRGENGERVPDGERGEIIIAGPNVSPGYLNRPDLTERAFFDSPDGRAYRTGDWGREREGQFFFEGRMDSQVKVNGFRIELGDLEANLRALEGIADAVVLSVEKAGRIDSLAAFIIERDRSEGRDFERSAKLKSRLGEKLPAYMIPRKIIFLDAFPMTPNGKADRRALAAKLGA